MRLFALSSALWAVAAVVLDAVLAYDCFDVPSTQPCALRTAACVALVILAAPPLTGPAEGGSALAQRVVAAVALGAPALAGLQRATPEMRAADALYTSAALLVAFWAATKQDELGRLQTNVAQRRTVVVERTTAALFAASVSFYAALRAVRRATLGASHASEFTVQLSDGTFARGAGFAQPYAGVQAAGAGFTAMASLGVILTNAGESAALVVSVSLIVQLLVALNDALAFIEVLHAFPALVAVPASSFTNVQKHTLGVAATRSSSGPALLLAIAQLLLYRSVVEGVDNLRTEELLREESEPLKSAPKALTPRVSALSANWLQIAGPSVALAAVALCVAWTSSVQDDGVFTVVFVALFAACSIAQMAGQIEIAAVAVGVVGVGYVVFYAAVANDDTLHTHPTYFLFLASMALQLSAGALDTALRFGAPRALQSVADACAYGSLGAATFLYTGWALLTALLDGAAVAGGLADIKLTPVYYGVHLVVVHDIGPLVVLPSVWSRARRSTQPERLPARWALGCYLLAPTAAAVAYFAVAAVVGVSESSATNAVFYDADITLVTMCAFVGAVLLPWLSVGLAFAFG
jgi:hypothetical protein